MTKSFLSSSLTRSLEECRKRYISPDNFLRLFNPSLQHVYCQDIKRVFTGGAPELSVLSGTFGEEVTRTWLNIQIRDLSEYCGCRDKISVLQINSLSKTIISLFYYLKVTELMYFFLLMKGGRFGHFYGSVDSMKITSSIQQFISEVRNPLLAQYYREEEEANERNPDDLLTYEEWEELKYLFRMGYEPWRIKKELEEQRRESQK